MTERLLSVGIDIGTTTTQLVFSRLTLEKKTGSAAIPELSIGAKEVTYRSQIHFTPLIGADRIDCAVLQVIVAQEYAKAGLTPEDLDTGAIIITGETARKENAKNVLDSLAEYAGDFVVSTAGPDLEALLAGWGAGTGELSKTIFENVINFDIGGGTTNAALFFNGEVQDVYALDIGGRLLRFDANRRLTYLSGRLAPLLPEIGIHLNVGMTVTFSQLETIARRLAESFLELINLRPVTEFTKALFIGHAPLGLPVATVSFSGGVAEYIYNGASIRDFCDLPYWDIGPLLGATLRRLLQHSGVRLVEPEEKIRATVLGAGNHAVKLTGSTVTYSARILPLKNIPVLQPFTLHEQEEWELLAAKIQKLLPFFPDEPVAIAIKGRSTLGFGAIKTMARQIVSALAGRGGPIIVVLEHDLAKALGQLITIALPQTREVICLDRIKVKGGDYIDIGMPVAGVIPVVIKTLVFNT
jgi:ethanolamine utilization protein EutA